MPVIEKYGLVAQIAKLYVALEQLKDVRRTDVASGILRGAPGSPIGLVTRW
jgi:hypothetical protein